MKKYKIFISGVQKELKEERRAIKEFVLGDALLSEYFDLFLFEDSPAKGRSSESAYLEEVRKSDIYIGILGQKYGGAETGRISPTEAEFREAKSKHKEILIYIKGQNTVDEKRDSGVQKLIKEIKNPKAGYSYKRFEDAEELTNKEYQKKFDLRKRQSTDDLKELEVKGILARVGTTGKGTYYILKGAPKGQGSLALWQ